MVRISVSLLAGWLLLTGCRERPGGEDEIPPLVSFPTPYWDGEKRAEIFYEIFVRAFSDSDGDGIGDLDGVTAKLDYLDKMGVTGIWLMPINPSPSYHGYDVTDYTDVNPDYGTLEDFDELVAAAHSKDIKVIIDFVINHTSSSHPWFTSAAGSEQSPCRDFYLFSQNPAADIPAGLVPMTDSYIAGQWHMTASGSVSGQYMGMFSSSMPEINYHDIDDVDNSPAYTAICDAARFWLERGADGFRLDAVKHIYQSETSDENPRFLARFYDDMRAVSPDVYIVGEVLSESWQVAPYYAGLPALFDFSSWWRLEWALNNSAGKWYPKDLLEYEAMFEVVRPYYIHATKLSNHDEDRTGSTLGGDPDKMKMAAKVLLTVSGEPYIYYGEEIGMLGTKQNGDENVRRPFVWADQAAQQADGNSLWNVYSRFMALRNSDPVMALGKMSLPDGFVDTDQTNKQIMAFYREHEGVRYLVLHNLSGQPTTYVIGQAVKRGVFRHGEGTITKYGPTRYSAALPAWGTIICELVPTP